MKYNILYFYFHFQALEKSQLGHVVQKKDKKLDASGCSLPPKLSKVCDSLNYETDTNLMKLHLETVIIIMAVKCSHKLILSKISSPSCLVHYIARPLNVAYGYIIHSSDREW